MNEDKKAVPGKNGGTLFPQQAGQPAPANAGRKKNPFRYHIQELAENDTEILVDGFVIDANGQPVGEKVKVLTKLPGALAVVLKAYRLAAKGDAQARKWLTEAGYDKTVNLANDPDNPLGGAFAVILPSNDR